MASSDLRAELDCSVCLNIYTDPVMLKCGHNYCRACIDWVLDTQSKSGVYFCPQCREEFQERPALHGNITLRNISQQFLSAQSEQKESGIFCTYCINTSVSAVRFCLLCEASLCDSHLNVHSRSPEHILCDPTTSQESGKCSVHNKVVVYYCTEDAACICVSCILSGEHRGHQVDTLQEASTKKKKKLADNLQKLFIKSEEIQRSVQSLQEHRVKVQGKANVEAERVAALFRDPRKRLDDLETRILNEVFRQEEQLLKPVNHLIQQLETKKDDLSKRIRHVEELSNMTNPTTLLQESETGDLDDTNHRDEKEVKRLLHGRADLNVAANSRTFRTGLSDIITAVIGGIYTHKAENMLLDEDSAHDYLWISNDRRTVSKSGKSQDRLCFGDSFEDYYQVLGSRSFSSGRHYWEVNVKKSNNWRVGMCYDSIDMEGDGSLIGCNDVSWALSRTGKKYEVIHDGNVTQLDYTLPCERVWVYLDYEAGQISFYQRDPIKHLHTFSANFTEPLYAVLGVWHGSISMC